MYSDDRYVDVTLEEIIAAKKRHIERVGVNNRGIYKMKKLDRIHEFIP